MVILRGWIPGGLVLQPHLFQLRRCVKGVIGMTVSDELIGVLLVESLGLAFTLTVRAMGAGFVRAFVGFQSAPAEAVKNILFGAFDVAALVGIFDPEYKIAAVPAGKKVVVENGPNTAQV